IPINARATGSKGTEPTAPEATPDATSADGSSFGQVLAQVANDATATEPRSADQKPTGPAESADTPRDVPADGGLLASLQLALAVSAAPAVSVQADQGSGTPTASTPDAASQAGQPTLPGQTASDSAMAKAGSAPVATVSKAGEAA